VFEDVLDVRDCVHDALVGQQRHRLRLRDGFQGDSGLRDDGEGPLAAREQTREVDGAVPGLVDESVEVVAGDVPLQVREPGVDLVGVLVEDVEDARVDAREEGLGVSVGLLAQGLDLHLAEGRDGPVREHHLALLDVGVRLPVLQGVRARGVVPDCAADGASGCRPPGPARTSGRAVRATG